ncbi:MULTISPECIES: hypothetical protein [unclassified Streptomyces]|uniref:hypothetical protein n=1 Tax=unclassified Streptomyces TaxID=2593676 RepID=UPI000DD7E51F|nr:MULTISPECIES: hypothetical protein [unclassified Streptomyces]QZZ27854.1 hypothetical protein A7X85_17605 [Streptomyces sp. ST1015]
MEHLTQHTPETDDTSLAMTVEIHGVFQRHVWIDQVSADHDLDEDLFSLVVKRAAAYGWSSAFFGGLSDLAGARWHHADAGNDWSQDGRNRRLAWLTVYPTAGMARQHRLPAPHGGRDLQRVELARPPRARAQHRA